MQHELGKAFRGYGLDIVAALDAERPQPVMMNQRRARMRGRPSDQARGGSFGHGCHCQSCCNALKAGIVPAEIGQAAVAVNARTFLFSRASKCRRVRRLTLTRL